MDTNSNKEIANPQVIFSWKAPLRAYKKRSVGVLRFYIALSLLLSLIVLFFGDKILVIPIWSLMFLFYVLTIVPPPETENKITLFGIETAGNNYRWDFFSHFYYIKKFDYYVLVVVSIPPYFYHLYLVVKDQETLNHIVKILSQRLMYQEKPKKTFTDKLSEWLTKLMPDDSFPYLKEKEASSSKGLGASL